MMHMNFTCLCFIAWLVKWTTGTINIYWLTDYRFMLRPFHSRKRAAFEKDLYAETLNRGYYIHELYMYVYELTDV